MAPLRTKRYSRKGKRIQPRPFRQLKASKVTLDEDDTSVPAQTTNLFPTPSFSPVSIDASSAIQTEFGKLDIRTPVRSKREHEDDDEEEYSPSSKKARTEESEKHVRFSDEVVFIDYIQPSKRVRFSDQVTYIEPESRPNRKVKFSDDVTYIEPDNDLPIQEFLQLFIDASGEERREQEPYFGEVVDELVVSGSPKFQSLTSGWWDFSLSYCVDGDTDPELRTFLEDEASFLQTWNVTSDSEVDNEEDSEEDSESDSDFDYDEYYY